MHFFASCRRNGAASRASGGDLTTFGYWPLMTCNSWLAKLARRAAAESRGSTIDGGWGDKRRGGVLHCRAAAAGAGGCKRRRRRRRQEQRRRFDRFLRRRGALPFEPESCNNTKQHIINAPFPCARRSSGGSSEAVPVADHNYIFVLFTFAFYFYGVYHISVLNREFVQEGVSELQKHAGLLGPLNEFLNPFLVLLIHSKPTQISRVTAQEFAPCRAAIAVETAAPGCAKKNEERRCVMCGVDTPRCDDTLGQRRSCSPACPAAGAGAQPPSIFRRCTRRSCRRRSRRSWRSSVKVAAAETGKGRCKGQGGRR
jgi:hypothetical protein